MANKKSVHYQSYWNVTEHFWPRIMSYQEIKNAIFNPLPSTFFITLTQQDPPRVLKLIILDLSEKKTAYGSIRIIAALHVVALKITPEKKNRVADKLATTCC